MRRRSKGDLEQRFVNCLALVPSTGLGAVTGGGGAADCCSSAVVGGGGVPPACSNIRCRCARRSMLARRYAAAALGVYDLGNVGGGVGLAAAAVATTPFSPPFMSAVAVIRWRAYDGKNAHARTARNTDGTRKRVYARQRSSLAGEQNKKKTHVREGWSSRGGVSRGGETH